jgi:hypothetical protein
MASKDELRRKLASLAPEDRELLASELAATTPAEPTAAERAARVAEVKSLAAQSTRRERVRRGTGLRAAAAAGLVTLTRRKPEPEPEPEPGRAEREPMSDNVYTDHPHRRQW